MKRPLVRIFIIFAIMLSIFNFHMGVVGDGSSFAGIAYAGEISKKDIVVYPVGVDTDFERLRAVYSLIEQMRLEHNKTAEDFRNRLTLELAPEDPEEFRAKQKAGFVPDWVSEGLMVSDTPDNNSLSAKFRTYAEASKTKLKQLLAEQNRLKEKIRWANYTLEQWRTISELSPDGQIAIDEMLFGSREVEKAKPTKATSSLLDELKALNLDDLPECPGDDPTEDFTSATWNNGNPQADPSSHISVTADRVTFDDITYEDAYFYSDRGDAYFDESFDHLFKVCLTFKKSYNYSAVVWYKLTNEIASGQSNPGLHLSTVASVGGWRLYLVNFPGGSDYTGYLSTGTVYYVEFERDEDVGEFGTAYAYICTGNYWDDGGTQVDTLSRTLDQEDDFRYCYAISSYKYGSYTESQLDGYIELLDLQEAGGPSAPTVATNAATSIEGTTATGNGNITDTGGENADHRGAVWDDASHGDPGNTAPDLSDYVTAGGGYTDEAGDFGTGVFTAGMTGLPTGTTVYYRAWAHNSGGYSYGGEQSFLTKPAAPTNISATDGAHTNRVVVTWTKSTGATGYKIYRDAGLIDTVGDVATYDDNGADAPTITPGNASASDGTDTAHVVLSLAGESANNGTTHSYKLRATNATGDSGDSASDNGYRGVGALTYQWQRSAADSDAAYGDIVGATTDPYNDIAAPAPSITPGSAVASDGSSGLHVVLTLAGESANNGDGRYYQCLLDATGVAQQTSTSDRGYRDVGALTYQWQRSAADSDAAYGNIGGGTTDPYNDTAAPAPTVTPGNASASDGTSSIFVTLAIAGESGSNGDGRWYQCVLDATGAAQQTSASNRGYRGVSALTRQWLRSVADLDASFGNLPGATTDPYNDTTGGITPDGRWYYAQVGMSGAVAQDTTHDRGYRSVGAGGVGGAVPIFLALGLVGLVLFVWERQKRGDKE